jgi:hypothetical protein
MDQQGYKGYRLVDTLYWFIDLYGNALDSKRLMLPGPVAFFFFSSDTYAESFLKEWLEAARRRPLGGTNPGTKEPISRDDWGLHYSDDADDLIAMCDDLAQLPGEPRAGQIEKQYEYFFVDPSPDRYSADLPMTLEAMKAAIEQKAQEGTPWP